MRAAGTFFVLAALASYVTRVEAQTSCTCSCFDGRPVANCTTPGETTICTPDICPPKPPVLAPLPAQKPAKICKSDMVWNEKTRQWEYHQVCTPG